MKLDFLGPKALVPPEEITAEYMKEFIKDRASASTSESSSLSERLEEIHDDFMRDLSVRIYAPIVAGLSEVAPGENPNERTCQLNSMKKLFDLLWAKQADINNFRIKLLQSILNFNGVNTDNYFDYLERFYKSWEETLIVAETHLQYELLPYKSFSGLLSSGRGISEALTLSSLESQATRYPEGRTAEALPRAKQLFASKKTQYAALMSTAQASMTPKDLSTQEPSAPFLPASMTPKDLSTQGASAPPFSALYPSSSIPYPQPSSSSSMSFVLPNNSAQDWHIAGENDNTQDDPQSSPLNALPDELKPGSSNANAPTLQVTTEASCAVDGLKNLYFKVEVTPTLSEIKAKRDPVHIIFIVDVSLSMKPAIEIVQQTLVKMISTKLIHADKVSIIKFGSQAEIVINAVSLSAPGFLETLPETLKTHLPASDNSTEILGGFEELTSKDPKGNAKLKQTNLKTHIILATDGQDTSVLRKSLKKEEYARMMLPHVQEYAQNNRHIPVHAIGMTTSVDQGITDFLTRETHGFHTFIPNQNQIGDALDLMATYICAADLTPAGQVTIQQGETQLVSYRIPPMHSGNSFIQSLKCTDPQKFNLAAEFTITCTFPDISELTHTIKHNPLARNIDAIAADINSCYERLIASGADTARLQSELFDILIRIIGLKTSNLFASWAELDEVEDKVRRYLQAVEEKNLEQQMVYNTSTLLLRSLAVRGPASPSSPSSTTPLQSSTNHASGPQTSTPLAPTGSDALIKPLNWWNLDEHVDYVRSQAQKSSGSDWRRVAEALIDGYAGERYLHLGLSPQIPVSFDNPSNNQFLSQRVHTFLTLLKDSNAAMIRSCLVERFIDVAHAPRPGWSWLMAAINYNANVEVIKVLVEEGVPLDRITSNSQLSALDMAKDRLRAAEEDKDSEGEARAQAIIGYLQTLAPFNTPRLSITPSPSSSTPSSSSSTPSSNASFFESARRNPLPFAVLPSPTDINDSATMELDNQGAQDSSTSALLPKNNSSFSRNCP